MDKTKSKRPRPRPRPKAKPTPKQAPKPRATAKRGPSVRQPLRKRLGKVTDGHKSMVSIAQGQLSHQKKTGCVDPIASVEVLNFERSWGRIIDAIDAYIRLAMIRSPEMFYSSYTPSNPTTPSTPKARVSSIRVSWLLAIQQYWYSAGVIAGGGDPYSANKVSDVALPYGLAKLAQAYCPYVDTSTGAKFSKWIPPLGNPAVYANYWSVDSYTGVDATINLSALRTTSLVHVSSWYSTAPYQLRDFATRTNGSALQTFDSTTTDAFTFYKSIATTERAAISKLYEGIMVTDMPLYATDNSASSVVTPLGITNAAFEFSPMASVLVGYFRNYGEQVDKTACYPFTKSLPVVMANRDGVDIQYITNYRVACYRLYAYMTSGTNAWANGPAEHLLRNTACFRTVTEFSFTGVHVDPARLASHASTLFPALTKGNVTTTQLWAMATSFWATLFHRMAPYDQIVDQNSLAYTGYASAVAWSKPSLPVALARVVSGIGPVCIAGKAYFPYFSVAPPGYLAYMNSSGGQWTMTSSDGYAPPGFWQCEWDTVNPNTRLVKGADGQGYGYNTAVRFCNLPSMMADYIRSQSMSMSTAGILMGRYVPVARTCLGRKSSLFALIEYDYSWGDFAYNYTLTAVSGGFSRRWLPNVSAVVAMVCLNYNDIADATLYGVCAATGYMDNNNYVRVTTVSVPVSTTDALARALVLQQGDSGDAYGGVNTLATGSKPQPLAKHRSGNEPLELINKESGNDMYSMMQPQMFKIITDIAEAIRSDARPGFLNIEHAIGALKKNETALVKKKQHKSDAEKVLSFIKRAAVSTYKFVAQDLGGNESLMSHIAVPGGMALGSAALGPIGAAGVGLATRMIFN